MADDTVAQGQRGHDLGYARPPDFRGKPGKQGPEDETGHDRGPELQPWGRQLILEKKAVVSGPEQSCFNPDQPAEKDSAQAGKRPDCKGKQQREDTVGQPFADGGRGVHISLCVSHSWMPQPILVPTAEKKYRSPR